MKNIDSDNIFNNNENEINYYKYTKKRSTKRWNVDACTFRLKFKFNLKGNYFSFKNTKKLIHNHTPNSSSKQKVRYIPFFLFFIYSYIII